MKTGRKNWNCRNKFPAAYARKNRIRNAEFREYQNISNLNATIQMAMVKSRATNGRQADSEGSSNVQPNRKRNTGRPRLRWRDQRTLQEVGTDHVWPNPRRWWCWWQPTFLVQSNKIHINKQHLFNLLKIWVTFHLKFFGSILLFLGLKAIKLIKSRLVKLEAEQTALHDSRRNTVTYFT
jgi:hypothetical protein